MKKLLVIVALAIVQGAEVCAEVKINAASENCKAQWFEEFVPMADGVKLYTIGVAPAGVGKCPIVVIRMPYVKAKRENMAAWEVTRRHFTSRGYACVYQHCRGCGMSEGDWKSWGRTPKTLGFSRFFSFSHALRQVRRTSEGAGAATFRWCGYDWRDSLYLG